MQKALAAGATFITLLIKPVGKNPNLSEGGSCPAAKNLPQLMGFCGVFWRGREQDHILLL